MILMMSGQCLVSQRVEFSVLELLRCFEDLVAQVDSFEIGSADAVHVNQLLVDRVIAQGDLLDVVEVVVLLLIVHLVVTARVTLVIAGLAKHKLTHLVNEEALPP